jgi:DNA-binding CsgD family transcriptional regulator
MNYFSIALYIFSVSIGFSTIYIAYEMSRKYRLKYLSTYLYFLISFYILGFFNLIGRYLALTALGGQPQQTRMLVNYLFGFMNFPFVVFSIYLFLYLMRGFLEKESLPTFNKFYFGFWAAVFLGQVLLTKNYFDTNNDQLLRYFYQSINLASIVGFCLIALYMLVKSRDLTDMNQRTAAKNFGLIYLLCFGFVFTVTSKFILPYFGPFKVLIIIFLFFTLNLPPLLYLRLYLNKYHLAPLAQPDTEAELQGFFSKHEISKREQEIIRLMLKGKSNNEIMKELFISLHTVKNHIYNIYQKLEVKNRLQINNLIRKYLQGEMAE